jgi:hypothetical protein
MWFWILVKGSFTLQIRVPAKQQRFHFIDVHASWKCSSVILRGRGRCGVWDWGGSNRSGGKAVLTIIIIIDPSFPWLCFFRAAQVCVNELRSCLRESCCKTKISMHGECKVQLYCMKTQLQQPQGTRGNQNGTTHKTYLLKHISFSKKHLLTICRIFPNWPQIVAFLGF